MPLQDRFPDRFTVQSGMLGEFTAITEKNEIAARILDIYRKLLDSVVDCELRVKPTLAIKVEH
jgi:hypothetical protein